MDPVETPAPATAVAAVQELELSDSQCIRIVEEMEHAAGDKDELSESQIIQGVLDMEAIYTVNQSGSLH